MALAIRKSLGVLAPAGFRGAGVACGLKPSGNPDLALIASDTVASAAGTFTTNRVCAAPVKVSRRRVKHGRLRAVVANSGNANACTGNRGLADARAMTAAVGRLLGVPAAEVAVASTGVIGQPLEMSKVAQGIERAVARLARSRAAAADVARAIMTTDTVPKAGMVRARLGRRTVTLGGIAKGAGMIAPKMRHATMLCFLTTDAAVEPTCLQAALDEAVARTFNCITVDGDTSTNDTVLLMAGGAAGGRPVVAGSRASRCFADALTVLCDDLAHQMVADAEGATKFIEIEVTAAASDRDAALAARAIAESPLFKTAMYGADPNWGRIAAATGYSGARVDEGRLRIALCGIPVVEGGLPLETPAETLRAAVQRKRVGVQVDLGLGGGCAHMYTCDLSHRYVDINAHYTT